MPPERVLTESDGPFAEIDGAALVPWNVSIAVGRLAEIWVLPYERADQAILANLRKLLGGLEVA
jgi:TatD DNase family protein